MPGFCSDRKYLCKRSGKMGGGEETVAALERDVEKLEAMKRRPSTGQILTGIRFPLNGLFTARRMASASHDEGRKPCPCCLHGPSAAGAGPHDGTEHFGRCEEISMVLWRLGHLPEEDLGKRWLDVWRAGRFGLGSDFQDREALFLAVRGALYAIHSSVRHRKITLGSAERLANAIKIHLDMSGLRHPPGRRLLWRSTWGGCRRQVVDGDGGGSHPPPAPPPSPLPSPPDAQMGTGNDDTSSGPCAPLGNLSEKCPLPLRRENRRPPLADVSLLIWNSPPSSSAASSTDVCGANRARMAGVGTPALAGRSAANLSSGSLSEKALAARYPAAWLRFLES